MAVARRAGSQCQYQSGHGHNHYEGYPAGPLRPLPGPLLAGALDNVDRAGYLGHDITGSRSLACSATTASSRCRYGLIGTVTKAKTTPKAMIAAPAQSQLMSG